MNIKYLSHCIMGVAITSLAACGGSTTSTKTDDNKAPTAVISVGDVDYSTGDSISVTQGQSLTFSAKKSNDPEDKDQLSYFWNKEEDNFELKLPFDTLGNSSVSLYVKDSQGKSSSPVVLVVKVQSVDKVLAIVISGDDEVEENKTIQLSADVDYETAENGSSVTWSVDAGTGTAEIDQSGQLTGLTAGTVTVKAEQGGVTKTKLLTVKQGSVLTIKKAEDLMINGDKAVTLGFDITLSASVTYNTGEPDNAVIWSVENTEGEAHISQAGVLSGDKAGMVTVTATSVLTAAVVKTYEVKVTAANVNAASKVEITGLSTVELTKDLSLTAVVTYTLEAEDAKVEWSLTNGTGEASISQAGVVTGIKIGLVTITAKSTLDNSVLAEHVLEVVDTSIPVLEAITLTGAASVKLNASLTLTVNAEYKNSANNAAVAATDLEWSSSDDTIVSVNNGVVKGLKEGESAIITAKYAGKTATKTIDVEAVVIPDVSIYVKAPAAWTTTMHYWSSITVTTTWPGEALDTAEQAGWHLITFAPAALPSAGIIINNGAATGTIKTVDLAPPSSSGCFVISNTADGTDSTGAPAHTASWQEMGTGDCIFGVARLKIAALPGSKSFVGESLEVTLSVDSSLAEGEQAYYTLDGSDPASLANSARLSYNDGDKITIGDTLALEQSLTLKLFADHSDSEGEDALESYTYTKTDIQSCTPNIDSGDFKFCADTFADAYEVTVEYKGSGDIDLAKSQILLNGAEVDADSVTGNTLTFSASGLVPSKYSYTLRLSTNAGDDIRPLYIPMWIGEGVQFADFGWKDSIMYQIFNDRFLDGDSSNNLAELQGVNFDSQWQGGDFAGITKKIKDGYFTDMGINTLWVSSPILNSHNTQPGVQLGDPLRYASYHSYHPVATGYTHTNKLSYGDNPIESAFGTPEEFKELINEAHLRGIRVVPDFVANHTHREAQIFQDHPSWFYNQIACAPNNWDAELRTACWFTSDMPDLNFKDNVDATKAVVDHALWIIEEFNIDGFRADALKHMDDEFVRALKVAVLEQIETRVSDHVMTDEATVFYMVGESLNSEWPRYHTREDMVHGQVNSTLYYAINGALLAGSDSLSSFANTAINEDTTYLSAQSAMGGSGGYRGAVMGNFFGNHDVDRALTRANGDYGRLRLAQTFLFTSPGNVPMLYQGDDIGTFGGADPANRLKMKFKELDGLSGAEEETLNHVRKVGLLRAAHPALRRGKRETVQAEFDFWVYKVSYQSEDVYVAINRGSQQSYTAPSGYTDGLGNCSGGNIPAGSSCIFVK